MSTIKKVINFEVKQEGPEENRVLRFVGSDETPDRDSDIILVMGWKLEQYLKNPVFLWSHDYHQPPIGKALNVQIDTGTKKLLFDIQFPTAEEYPFADTIYQLYKGGYLSATSVGFRGIKYKTRDDEAVLELPEWQRGRIYIEQELFELSACSVPCNPNALIEARSKGFSEEHLGKVLLVQQEAVPVVTEETKVEVPEEKTGAQLSAKNREILQAIHDDMHNCWDTMQKCRDRLKVFLDGTLPEEPEEGELSTPAQETKMEMSEDLKEAFEKLTSQVLLLAEKVNAVQELNISEIAKELCSLMHQNDTSKVEIDLDAIKLPVSEKDPDQIELNIEPGELKRIIREATTHQFNSLIQGGN